MPLDLQQFLSANASAVFGLIGALGGGLLSFFASVLLKRRDFNLQTWSKLLERRIVAHEKVISLAVEMRVMVSLGGIGDAGEVRRAPQLLISKEEFERWFTRFTQLTMEGTSWFTVQTKREVNHASTLAEYLNNLRWGIHDYLRPEFSRSIVLGGGDPPSYRYTYPSAVSSKFGQETYWDLMNLVRCEPYMRRFQVTKWLKKRY